MNTKLCRRFRMRLGRINLFLLSLVTLFVSTHLPVNFPGIGDTSQAIAQTPNDQKLNQNPVAETAGTGSFIDYIAEEVKLKGHSGSVNSASYSPDGKLIVTAGADGTARVWDTSGKQLVELRGHSKSVRSASFSPDGKRIVTASLDGTARVWNLSGKQLVELKGHLGNVYSANFSPDGKSIVTAGADKTVRLWDAEGKQLLEIIGHNGSVYSASFSPDGKCIVTASADKTARVWDLSAKQLVQIQGHTDTVWNASFNPDGKRIVTASDDKTARIWDLSGKQLVELNGHSDSVLNASFNADGKQIVTASVDRSSLVWESSGKLVGKLLQHQGGVNSANFSDDGKWIVTASNDGTARIWDTSRQSVRELLRQRYLSFSQDGQLILTVSSDNNQTVGVWDLNGKLLAQLQHQDNVSTASFSPNKKLITTVSGKTAQLWDIQGKLIARLQNDESIYYAIFSPDNQRIVTTGLESNLSKLWNIQGKLIAQLQHDRTKSTGLIQNRVIFSPDSQRLIIISGNPTAKVWDRNGKLLLQLQHPTSYFKEASFSPNHKLIVTTAHENNNARLWDINGKLLAQLPHDSSVIDAKFSPDGQRIVTTDGSLRLWNIFGKLLATLQDSESRFDFSRDGRIIIATSNNNTTIMWDTSGKVIADIEVGGGRFSADGKWIITTSNNIQVWNLLGKPLTTIKGLQGFQDNIYDVSLNSDANQIVTASADTIRIWYLYNKQPAEIQFPGNSSLSEVQPSEITSQSSYFAETGVFSPDGQKILTVSEGDNVEVWDYSGKLIAELKGYQNSLRKAYFSPDSKQVLLLSGENAGVWNIPSNKLIELKGHQENIWSASWSQDGQLIVTASRDGTARLWDSTGKLLAILKGHQGDVYAASFSPNGQKIVTASYDDIRVWDLSGKLLKKLKGGGNAAYFSSNGNRVIISAMNGTASGWDIASGKQMFQLKGHRHQFSDEVFLSPDGRRITISSPGEGVRVWDDTGKLLITFENFNEPPRNFSFSQNGQQIALVSNNYVEVRDLSGKLLAKFKGDIDKGDIDSFSNASLSPNGQQILITYNQAPARLFDLSGKQLAVFQARPSSVNSANFSPDGKYLVTSSSDKIARIWDNSGKIVTELQGHLASINSARFSPDSKLVVTASSDRSARVWDTSGKQLALLKGSDDFISSIAIDSGVTTASFSPDEKLILTEHAPDSTRIWDISGKLISEIPARNSRFSLDGKSIITVSSSSEIMIWNLKGSLLTKLPLPNEQLGVYPTISPDVKYVVISSIDDVTVIGKRLWVSQVSGNQKLVELKGHRGIANDVNFSPDSKQIVVASSDRTARIWNLEGSLLAELKGHQDGIHSANFSSDGQRIVTASLDGTARLWDTNGKLLSILSSSAPFGSPRVEADRLRDLQFYAPNCAAALAPWQQALNIYREIADTENEAIIQEKLGDAYYCLSDYTKAIASYSQAAEIARKSNYVTIQAKNLLHLGNLYRSLAEYDKAINFYNDALKVLEQNQDRQIKAAVIRGRGNTYIFQNKQDRAIKDYSQALAIDEANKNTSGIAEDKINLASIYHFWGDYTKAIQYYKEALDFSPIQAIAGLGNTYLALGDTAKAIALHQQSLEKARQQADFEGEGNALYNLAYAFRQAGNLAEAEKNLYAAIDIWENLRTKLEDANKISIFENQARTYRLLQQVLIAQNKFESALEIAERGRARAFVELLSRRTNPNAKEQSTPQPLNISQIKQVAKTQNTTLVEYSIIYDDSQTGNQQKTKESELYTWVIKPTGEVTFKKTDLKPLQKDNITLADLVVSSRQSIGVRGRGGGLDVVPAPDVDPSKNLKKLHELLIEPIADQLPTDPKAHVTFIPQSELFLVPFPALQNKQGKYLIEKHTILTAPAISVLDLTYQKRQQVSGKGALVVGNPTMPSVPPFIGEPPQQLPPLPGAEDEANAIAPLLKTKPLIGKNATKAIVVQQMQETRTIHLATHGLLDDFKGLGVPGAIALAPDGKDDGLLTSSEILTLTLNAELIVLSACDTGVGKITGDGVIGLSRSLITAGVPSVIVSLWSVPDAPTAGLMTEFYQNLQKNPDKAAALREAMLKTLKKHPQPSNWAAFTLIGEAE